MAGEPREREVRLGIVLYGGVSLAVYENGIAQELFRAVKGEGVYSLIKRLIGAEVVVDIVSGTSAGGVNGILLGYALANNRDFKSCSRLWREDGDLLKLLRNPAQKNASSLLDSRGYYQERLEAAYEGMPVYVTPKDGVTEARRVVSKTVELDAFITGTDLQGHVYTVFDEQGEPIDVKDHRAIFQLSYRAERKNAFDRGGAAALAKLSRVTSCFPVAFEPVQAARDKDKQLWEWGRLDSRENIFFIDGGVLDNKPFSSALEAIERRMAYRSVERVLLYVEPDPERFQGQEPLTAPPGVVRSAMDALIGIPGYQSIATDLQTIAAHNDRIQLYRDILRCAPKAPAAAPCFDASAGDAFWSGVEGTRLNIYLTARLHHLQDRAVDGILKRGGERRLLRDDQRRAGTALVKSFNARLQGDCGFTGDAEARAKSTLEKFDVYFRMRRLLNLNYFIKEQPPRGSSEAKRARVELRRRLNHQFALLEEIQSAMEAAIDQSRIPWESAHAADPQIAESRWNMVESIWTAILDTKDAGLRVAQERHDSQRRMEFREREALMGLLKERVTKVCENPPPESPPPVEGNLLLACDSLEREIIRGFAHGGAGGDVARQYCNFPAVDSYLYPMQRLARMESVDLIHTFRVSPVDARRAYSAQRIESKLCGRALADFGGFLKRSWRANDTLWGRLDGVCRLVDCLVTRERIKGGVAPDRHELTAMFPNAESGDLERIAELASEFVAADSAPGDAEFSDFLDALVRAAQSEILVEEAPVVVDAAIRQHADWNQFPVARLQRRILSEKMDWEISPKLLDRAVMEYAAGEIAAGATPANGWPRYFAESYRVGRETWQNDIPKTILVEMATQSALVLRNCLLGDSGSGGDKIRSSLAFQAINVPMITLNRLARLSRTAPEYAWVRYSALALPLLLLAFEYPLRALVFGSKAPPPQPLWVAAPAVIFVLAVLWLFAPWYGWICYFALALLAFVLALKLPLHFDFTVSIPNLPGPRFLGPGVAALLAGAVGLALLLIRLRARRNLTADAGILDTLRRVLDLPEERKGSLFAASLRRTAMDPWPSKLIGADGNLQECDLQLPGRVAGPVLNFAAREQAGAELRAAITRELFAGLPLQDANRIAIMVERLRQIELTGDVRGWLIDHWPAAGGPAGLTVQIPRILYEGTVTLTVALPREFTPLSDAHILTFKNTLKERRFRIQSSLEGGLPGEVRLVSTEPVVFAFLAANASFQPPPAGPPDEEGQVKFTDIPAPARRWWRRFRRSAE